jgi:hypothetical protein
VAEERVLIPIPDALADKLHHLYLRVGTERAMELLDRMLRDSLPPAPCEAPPGTVTLDRLSKYDNLAA